MYRRMGWDRAAFAKEFRIVERTVQNWECGRSRIPYAVFKLLRLRLRDELPGWDEWSFVAGQLVSPEGHRYGPKDFSWLSLTVRQAKTCSMLYHERKGMRLAIEEAHQHIALLKTALLTSEGAVRLADLLAEGDPLFDLLADLRRGWTPIPDRDVLVTRPVRATGGTDVSVSGLGSPGREGLVTPPVCLTGEKKQAPTEGKPGGSL